MCDSKSGRKAGLQLGDTELEQQDSTAELQPKKRKTRGRQLGHGSPPGVQETALSSGPKEEGRGLLLEKLTRVCQQGGETERGGCLTLTWSVKASCSFLAATQSHFYLPDAQLAGSPEGRERGGVKRAIRERKRHHGKFSFTARWLCLVFVLVVWMVGGAFRTATGSN